MCMYSTEENNGRYESMKNKGNKVVSKAMRKKAKGALTELKNCQDGKFMLSSGCLGMGNEEERNSNSITLISDESNDGAKTRFRVDSMFSEEFEVKVWMHQGSFLSTFLFAVVVDLVTEFVRECVLSEVLYDDDFVLISETIEGLRNRFLS